MSTTTLIIVLACVLGGLAFIAVCTVVWWISTSNKFVKLRNIVDEAFSTMDVCLKERYDLIPNLVETVKGYAKHEQDSLVGVINARNGAINATSPEAKFKCDAALTGALKSLFAVAEAYPNLKADAHFTKLMEDLKGIEERIFSSRKYYNGTVREFNTKLEVFPSSIVARRKGLEKRALYELQNEEERQNVKVQF